jgi:membrane protease subunit (stomatin/prohibitin family)
MELTDALRKALADKWLQKKGIELIEITVNSATIPKEDEDMIKELQKRAVMRDPSMAAATMVGAQADAMKAAASNENGAMMGFMGMGMAQNAGGMNANQLFQMANAQKQETPVKAQEQNGWTCACGATNTGKFCVECGAKKPEDGWMCACGAKNKGKFCPECGAKKPAGANTGSAVSAAGSSGMKRARLSMPTREISLFLPRDTYGTSRSTYGLMITAQ